jgi:hypothetical protein
MKTWTVRFSACTWLIYAFKSIFGILTKSVRKGYQYIHLPSPFQLLQQAKSTPQYLNIHIPALSGSNFPSIGVHLSSASAPLITKLTILPSTST